MDANSVWTCLTILQDEQLFTKKDVTFMQWLCTETGCEALNAKCIDYARKQGAIFFSEKQPGISINCFFNHVEYIFLVRSLSNKHILRKIRKIECQISRFKSQI